ncbi:MAG: peptide deformylase [Candidatus Pacebacteria bacterium]|nr:peptide deformylase [Candidatus Paceibacterota bacterium]
MKIISAPHQTLRQKAIEVKTVDKKLIKFIEELELTLKNKENPKGVGLAAPQVDKKLRIFTTQLSNIDNFDDENSLEIKHYINPIITKHAGKQTFGPDKNNPQLEGCLSIPKIYAPVPRWEWVELEYMMLENGKLIPQKERFDDFYARVIQHEADHLDGILFTDYALEYDLPVYFENNKTGKLEETTNISVLETL